MCIISSIFKFYIHEYVYFRVVPNRLDYLTPFKYCLNGLNAKQTVTNQLFTV